jgi:hypothetical protein
MYTNNKELSQGFQVGSQTPIDDRLVAATTSALQNLGTGNVFAYKYYEGLKVLVLSNLKEYIWKESATGLLTTSFTYPANIVSAGITYSNKAFNWVEYTTSSNLGTGTINRGTRWTSANSLGDASFIDNGTNIEFNSSAISDTFTQVALNSSLPTAFKVINSGSAYSGDICVSAVLTGASNGSKLYSAHSISTTATNMITGYSATLTNVNSSSLVGARNTISGGTDVAAGSVNKITTSLGFAIGGSFSSGFSSTLSGDSIYKPSEGTSFGLTISSGINTGNPGNVVGFKAQTIEDNSNDNYGLIVETKNAGSGLDYPLWVQDGTATQNSLNKVLVADTLGKMTLSHLSDISINNSSQAITSSAISILAAAPFGTLYFDTTSNSITVALPAANTVTGREYKIKRISGGTNTLTIDPNAAETIDGASTKVLYHQWDSIKIQSNGIEWRVISNYLDISPMKIGEIAGQGGQAFMAHKDHFNATDYALVHTISGGTYVNAKATWGLFLQEDGGSSISVGTDDVTVDTGKLSISSISHAGAAGSAVLNLTPMAGTLATALTPANGDVIMVSSTNGVFTSTGLWFYIGGAWTKA